MLFRSDQGVLDRVLAWLRTCPDDDLQRISDAGCTGVPLSPDSTMNKRLQMLREAAVNKKGVMIHVRLASLKCLPLELGERPFCANLIKMMMATLPHSPKSHVLPGVRATC